MLTRIATKVLLLLILFSGVLAAEEVQPKIVVVVHPQLHGVDQLSPAQLRRIFTMRQSSWPNGKPIKVFVLQKGHGVHDSFTKSVLKLFPYQLQRVWDKLVYSGLADKPSEVTSLDEMADKIAGNENAIGYTFEQSARGLKIVKIGGKP
ncbi:hypothetical protein QX776_11420 [Alteromonadaceae bacterium BrNp21-10]|nr:hypothetical protein [Alteromonadaceae bacterium BrNp21-10]